MKRSDTNRLPGMTRAGRLLAALSVMLLVGAATAAAESEFDYQAQPLRVGVWVDRDEGDVYRRGDPMTVGFQANEDAYAVVYRIDTEGEVTILWPRTRLDDGFVFGGHEYVLPVSGARRLRVSSVEGEGFVEAIVSRYPFDLRGLELDFHHENRSERYAFRVAGDPFLAMNEVNFAVTGLEDPDDYVVTNYASYYVHRKVDHPRFLCGQCHYDEGTNYDPYRDSCNLNITVDYRWSNGWWSTYGYYPIYSNPVYVYVDPWTWRPWVNFWYDPWWRVPYVRVCDWPYDYYTWHDHPRYRGNCWTGGGHARYRPLTPGWNSDGSRTKVREYGRITPMLAGGAKTATRGSSLADGRTPYRGDQRIARSRPVIEDGVRTRGTAGLRIRDGNDQRRSPADGTARVRHTAGNTRERSAVVPVVGGPTGGGRRDATTTPRDGTRRQVDQDRRGAPRAGDADGRAIRPVEPRQKGTRIWNTGRGGADSGSQRPEQVRPGGRTGGDSSRDGAVRTRRDRGADRSDQGSSGGSQVRPRRGGDDGDSGRGSGTRTRSGGDDNSGRGGGTRTRSGGDDNSGRGGGKATRSGGGSSVRDNSSRSGGSATRSGGGSSVRDNSSRSGGSARSSGGGRASGSSSGRSGGGSSRQDGGRRGR